jgi:hypothetical protein
MNTFYCILVLANVLLISGNCHVLYYEVKFTLHSYSYYLLHNHKLITIYRRPTFNSCASFLGTSSAQKLAVLSRQESVLPSAIVQSPQHSDSTGRKNTDTYGLSDDKFQRMRNGMNRLRRNAAGRLNQTVRFT